ncbi:MAG: RluA family pseudouridine synthase [Opitutales bacterium]|nr:RluA family pseudouridine synthase [Opitutales bacterium]
MSLPDVNDSPSDEAVQDILVPPEAAGTRVDQFLTKHLPDLSRVRVQSLLRGGHILLNGQTLEKKTKLKGGEILSVDIPPLEKMNLEPVDFPLEILYEDEDFLALNKPAGMIVHPGNGVGHETTLVHALLAHCAGALSGIGGVERPGIVHRLDKETSGVMVVAKKDTAHRALAEAFADRDLEKRYEALVMGVPHLLSGVCSGPIGRHSVHRHKMAVVEPEAGKEARTDWKLLEPYGKLASRLGFRLHSGRTHQIRVHSSELGHPLLGDRTYGFNSGQFGGPTIPRVMLHSRQLILTHPRTRKTLELVAPYPTDWQETIGKIKGAA